MRVVGDGNGESKAVSNLEEGESRGSGSKTGFRW